MTSASSAGKTAARTWYRRMAEVTRIAPVLLVASIDSAASYYRDRLGFECEFRGDPRVMAVHRDQATILLVLTDEPELIVPHWRVVTNMWNAYVLVDDVEAMYAEVRERGATIDYEPYDSPWGFREFGVQDRDGYDIGFGQPRP
jgi:uncharacterized glyoxalase superfamily protein PhnB